MASTPEAGGQHILNIIYNYVIILSDCSRLFTLRTLRAFTVPLFVDIKLIKSLPVHIVLFCSILFFSRPRSESWSHHGHTFSIYLCPLSFWLTLPRRVLSTPRCCPTRPCVAFFDCVHLALFIVLYSFSKQHHCFLME